MNAIKSTLSLLVAVSLMGLTLIAQHNFQRQYAPASAEAVSPATPDAETLALAANFPSAAPDTGTIALR